jgi:hypothetical protein
MDNKTGTLLFGILAIAGLALALIGSSQTHFNQPISESKAIDNAAHKSVGPDGKTTYSISGAELHQARHQMHNTNTARSQKRQSGKSLSFPGIIMLFTGGVGLFICKSKSTETQKTYVDQGSHDVL